MQTIWNEKIGMPYQAVPQIRPVYDGEQAFLTPIRGSDLANEELSYNLWLRRGLARHEIVNKRLKQFRVLNYIFRHTEEFHRECFMACAVLTQLSMQEEPIHDISF